MIERTLAAWSAAGAVWIVADACWRAQTLKLLKRIAHALDDKKSAANVSKSVAVDSLESPLEVELRKFQATRFAPAIVGSRPTAGEHVPNVRVTHTSFVGGRSRPPKSIKST